MKQLTTALRMAFAATNGTPAFAFNMIGKGTNRVELGVQCPSMRSAMNTNELYTIPAPPGALRSRTTFYI